MLRVFHLLTWKITISGPLMKWASREIALLLAPLTVCACACVCVCVCVFWCVCVCLGVRCYAPVDIYSFFSPFLSFDTANTMSRSRFSYNLNLERFMTNEHQIQSPENQKEHQKVKGLLTFQWATWKSFQVQRANGRPMGARPSGERKKEADAITSAWQSEKILASPQLQICVLIKLPAVPLTWKGGGNGSPRLNKVKFDFGSGLTRKWNRIFFY